MAQVDDRVVAMSFESSKFTTGVSTAMNDINKLNSALSGMGSASGLGNIEKEANKITFGGLQGAINKVKGMFTFPEATQGFSDIEKESNKPQFTGINNAVDKLKGKFHFPEAQEGFGEIERASGRVQFTGLHSAIAEAAKSFSVIQGAAAVALGGIAANAANQGRKIASGIFGPIKGGLDEYETNLNSIQTILANTQASGATLKDVNKALLDLNKYSDKTIYNFSQMAKNIGTFTAAGVDLDTATSSIKGIANLAAISGSTSEQASTAMYQLSQAISSGRVSLQDWNSVVNAGMGGTVFQRALVQTAEHMGTLNKGAVELKGKMKNVTIEGESFRESVQAKPGEKSWLTSDVLTKTLSQLSGDMTTAQLKAEGYTDAQIKAIQAQAKMAVNAATEVKTLSGVLDTAKEAIGSGWAQTWQIVFGDFAEAKSLFTGLSNAINGFIGASANARNSVLSDWKKLGGRTDLIEGFKNIFEGVLTIIRPIKDAFRDIFPRKTGEDLKAITQAFEDFTDKIKIGPTTAENLKASFKGLFALLDIGKQILGGIFTAVGHLLGGLSDGSGGVLEFTGNIGSLIVKLDQWLKKGDKVHDFFAGLGDTLAQPLSIIGKFTGALNSMFGSQDSGATHSITALGQAMDPAAKSVDHAAGAFDKLGDVLKKLKDIAKPVLDTIKEALGNAGDSVAEALKNINFDKSFTVIQTGLIAGIFLAIKKGLSGGVNVDIGGGFLKNINGLLGTLKGNLEAIQQDIKAHAILQIALAVGVLAASVFVLAQINPERLGSSMAAMSAGLAELMAVMLVMNKTGGGLKAAVGIGGMATSMTILGTALLILSGAMLILSKLDYNEIGRGLTAIAGLLVVVAAGAKLLSGNALTLTAASVGLIAIGVALTILAGAMKIFATMSLEDIGKGLLGAAAGIIAVGLAANALPMSMLITGPALIVLATGLSILAGAVKLFGSMDVATLAKGIGAIALSLVGIGLAMGLMPPTMPLTAIGLTLVAGAMVVLAGAVAAFGNMDMGTLAKGIGAMGLSLVVLAAGLTLMLISLPGAAAFAVFAAALAVFVPALGLLGEMDFSTIFKGLAAIAASLVVIGLAGTVAAPGFIALGVGITVLGAGIFLLGAGVKLLASGIAILAGEGTKGVGVFFAALTGLVAIMPTIIITFIKGLVEIVAQIAELAPKVAVAIGKILATLLQIIIDNAPKVAAATTALIQAMLKVLADNAGPLIEAGWQLLLALLKGISDHIGQVVEQVADIVVKFLNAVASAYPRIVTAGFNVLLNFLRGIGNNITRVIDTAGDIVAHIITGIGNNIGKVISAGSGIITKFIEGVGNSIDNIIDRGAAMVNRIITGIGNNIGKLVDKGTDMAVQVIKGLADAAVKLATAGGDAVLDVLRGVRKWLDDNASKVGEEGRRIAVALIGGLASGVLGIDVTALAKNVINHIKGAIGKVKKFFHIGSPSRWVADEVGMPLAQGIALGMSDGEREIERAGASMLQTLRSTLRDIPAQIDMDVNPTITPVLDLTQVKQEAKKLGDISNVTPIRVAAEISAAREAQLNTDVDPETGAKVFKFEQTNISPVALSEAEIYRQTNNQLSQAKSALGL